MADSRADVQNGSCTMWEEGVLMRLLRIAKSVFLNALRRTLVLFRTNLVNGAHGGVKNLQVEFSRARGLPPSEEVG